MGTKDENLCIFYRPDPLVMKSRIFLTLTFVMLMVGGAMRGADTSPYLFYDFNDASKFPAGVMSQDVSGLQVITPDASIQREEDHQAFLEVSGSVALLARRFTGDGQTHFEAWVRPRAVAERNEAEFLDYDGAALALFLTAEGRAEIHALHIVNERQAFWVSSGIQIPIQNGTAESWHVIHITQHWQSGTWDLAVDGVFVLQGLGRGACADGKVSEVWLYGHGGRLLNAFDDLLLSAEPPEILEQNLAALHELRRRVATTMVLTKKRVGHPSNNNLRRQHSLSQPDIKKVGMAKILNIHLQVVGGGRHIGEFESDDSYGEKQKFALYTPGYDEHGKPKPLEVRISCDAELKEGATLGDIEWAITEHPGEGRKKVRVILCGTFQNGPRLFAKVPSEWSNKPLSIRCGNLGLSRQ